jgi:MFS transporter, DHA1 family, tetracycline resistance protein
MSSTSSKSAFAFIFTVVLLDVISMGIVIPVLPKLVEEFAGSSCCFHRCLALCPIDSDGAP